MYGQLVSLLPDFPVLPQVLSQALLQDSPVLLVVLHQAEASLQVSILVGNFLK